jgi:hypothetical protein
MSQAAAASPLQNKVVRIENKLDTEVAADLATSSATGGMAFRSMLEVMEFSKLMAVSDIAVPKHLRGNVGACLAVCVQAIEWRMSPYAVANKSYVVNDRISYESQLIHAVVEQRAPLAGRLRCSYSGVGNSRKCKVWAHIKGEDLPLEFESAEFEMIQPKNSPLWKTKPDLQLFYNASRDWARMYFPDVILGVYAEDEIERLPLPTSTSQSVAAPEPELITEEQRTALVDLAKELGVVEMLGAIVKNSGFEMLAHITVDRYSDVEDDIRTAGIPDAEIVDDEASADDKAEAEPVAEEKPVSRAESQRVDQVAWIDDFEKQSDENAEAVAKVLDGRELSDCTPGQVKEIYLALNK